MNAKYEQDTKVTKYQKSPRAMIRNFSYRFVIRTQCITLLLLMCTSCGKKKQIISYGDNESDGIVTARFETFVDRDSAFETMTDAASGKLMAIERAKNLAELKDSTYVEERFYIPSGKPKAFKKYIAKKREGKWETFYESGKIESETDYKNGLLLGYETYFESGKLKVKGELLPDHTFRHREFFENGEKSKEMATDSAGNGTCSYWYSNKKMKSSGPICDFLPCGVWKGWDTAGKPGPDELLGIPSE